jgi:hypothetical protein
MNKVFSTDHNGEPLPEAAVLTPEQMRQVAGGLNPQPLPPGEERLSAKLD